MHQPHTYFMLWANQGSWIFQCPVTLQSCICQVLWVSFRFQLSESEFHTAISHYSYLSPELSIPCFLPDSQNFMSRPWSSMKPSLTKERSDWQTSIFFLRLLFFTLTSPLLVTPPLLLFVLLFFLLFFLLLSFSICLSLSHWTKSFVFTLYSVLSLVLTLAQSLMFPFLRLSLALALSITDNLPRVASIHFSALKLSTPFLTQNPKGGKLKKESRRRELELERENERLGRKKSLISKAWNPFFAAWPG